MLIPASNDQKGVIFVPTHLNPASPESFILRKLHYSYWQIKLHMRAEPAGVWTA